MTTLKITVGEADELRDRARERIRTAQEGGDLEDTEHVLNFESYADMARLLSEANLELLEAIAENDPSSMREAADLVDRNIKDVHRNLTELESLNVVEFEEDGRAKRPVVRYDRLEIEVDLQFDGGTRVRSSS